MRYCSIDGCKKLAHNNGRLCAMHAWRIAKYGDPNHSTVDWHGETGSQDYRTWQAIKKRCYDIACKNYGDYGGRGITVCDRWINSYTNFINDMGHRPSSKYSLDRIDNDGNYEPGNCRWATVHQQIANRRRKANHVGVFFTNQYKSWEAQLKIEGKFVLRRKFDTEAKALAARKEAEIKYLGGTL